MREIAYTRQLTPTPRDPHAKATPNLKGHLGSPRGLYSGRTLTGGSGGRDIQPGFLNKL